MILELGALLFPNYYKRVWNEEFLNHMETSRKELYIAFPKHHDLVDKYIDAKIKELLK